MLLTEPAADVRGPRAARFPRASVAPVGEAGFDGDGLRDCSCEGTRGEAGREPGRLPVLLRRATGTATGALGTGAGAGARAGAGSGAATGEGWKDGIGRSSSSSNGGSLKTGGRGGKSSVSGGGSLKAGRAGCAGFSSGGGGGTSGVGVLASGGGGGMLAKDSAASGGDTCAGWVAGGGGGGANAPPGSADFIIEETWASGLRGFGLAGTTGREDMEGGRGEAPLDILRPVRCANCSACNSLRSAPAEMRLRLIRMSTGRVRRRTGVFRCDSRFLRSMAGGTIESYLLMRSMKSTEVSYQCAASHAFTSILTRRVAVLYRDLGLLSRS